jgi:hypothetical protein
LTYKIGDFLTNTGEVFNNAVIVEIMHIWRDPDDGEMNFIVKCRGHRKVLMDAEGRWAGMSTPWYFEDELKLLNEFTLDKYFRSTDGTI